MGAWIAAWIAAAVTMVAVDLVWLGVIAKGFYRSQIGELLLERPNLAAAGAFYVLYPLGVVVFAVAPALASGGWIRTALLGAGFGFFCYATYDLTNLATLKGWTLPLVLLDVAWGAVLTSLVAAAGLAAARLAG